MAFWDSLTRGISNLGGEGKKINLSHIDSGIFFIYIFFFGSGVADLRGDVPAITSRANSIKCHAERSGETAGGL